MKNTFGKNLKFCRGSMTQRELADWIGTSQQYVSRLERDECEPTATLLRKIIKALDTTFEDLFDGVPLD